MKIYLVFYGFCLIYANALDIKDIVITVSSQSNKYHRLLAENLRNDVQKQAQLLQEEPPIVHLSQTDIHHVGRWTILPLIPHLTTQHGGNCSWFLFVEDRTRIRLERLVETLEKYNHNKEIWLGYTLEDKAPTYIHDFAPGKLKYPNTASGFVISSSLMKRLANRWKHYESSASYYTIDHAYELALFIWNKSEGSALKHEPAFCISEEEYCASFPVPFKACGKLIPKDSIYFAVKTCQKFHKDRVAVVKRTWGQQAALINFISDVQDESIPTIALGIPNTERGHCGKTMAIIKHPATHISKLPGVKWMVLADDDTILSVTRLQALLTCYDDTTPVALGERYGYNVYDNIDGYNYITSGGGIVLSRALVQKLAILGACECPFISSPDDIILGICFARMGIDITHSPLFHQARPVDYAVEYLKDQPIVSFHKLARIYNKADLQIASIQQYCFAIYCILRLM